MTSTFPHTTTLKPSVTETEFLLTLSRQYQADKCAEQRKISNYWMGSSLLSYVWIINSKVWVIIKLWAEADNTNTRFNNLWYHAKTEFNNCFIVRFLKSLKKKILLSEFAQFENTTWSRGLDTRQTLNQYWVTILTSHVIVGWLFGLNQSEFS